MTCKGRIMKLLVRLGIVLEVTDEQRMHAKTENLTRNLTNTLGELANETERFKQTSDVLMTQVDDRKDAINRVLGHAIEAGRHTSAAADMLRRMIEGEKEKPQEGDARK